MRARDFLLRPLIKEEVISNIYFHLENKYLFSEYQRYKNQMEEEINAVSKAFKNFIKHYDDNYLKNMEDDLTINLYYRL